MSDRMTVTVELAVDPSIDRESTENAIYSLVDTLEKADVISVQAKMGSE